MAHQSFGLSYALGAFLAGLMLAARFRHQIEVEIRPFRDILLGLFFITISMLADVHLAMLGMDIIACRCFQPSAKHC